MCTDARYLKNAGAVFNGMCTDARYLKNAGALDDVIKKSANSESLAFF